jgi:hypothetical protein
MAHCAYCSRDNHPGEQICYTEESNPIYFCNQDHLNRWLELQKALDPVPEAPPAASESVPSPPSDATVDNIPVVKRRGRPPKKRA